MSEIKKLEKKIEELKKNELKTREEIEALEKERKASKKKKKEKEVDDKGEESHRHSERDKDGKFKEKEPKAPKDIKVLTEKIEEMSAEIKDLKKTSITRKKPSEAKQTKEEDLPESVTVSIKKNMFEVDV